MLFATLPSYYMLHYLPKTWRALNEEYSTGCHIYEWFAYFWENDSMLPMYRNILFCLGHNEQTADIGAGKGTGLGAYMNITFLLGSVLHSDQHSNMFNIILHHQQIPWFRLTVCCLRKWSSVLKRPQYRTPKHRVDRAIFLWQLLFKDHPWSSILRESQTRDACLGTWYGYASTFLSRQAPDDNRLWNGERVWNMSFVIHTIENSSKLLGRAEEQRRIESSRGGLLPR